MAGTHHAGAGHQGGFFGAAGGQHQGAGGGCAARAACVAAGFGLQGQRHRQGSAHGPQFTAQAQFTGKFMARQFGRVNQPVGRQQPQGNRQVKAATVFGQVSRGQVDGDALVGRKVQAAVLQRRAHALAGFFHFGVGQPHQGEAGQTVGQMHFDAHRWCVQAQQCTALDDGQTHV